MKVLPSEILNKINKNKLFSPSLINTIVNNRGSRVNDEEFYSELSIASIEYELEQTIPTNQITTKKIKF